MKRATFAASLAAALGANTLLLSAPACAVEAPDFCGGVRWLIFLLLANLLVAAEAALTCAHGDEAIRPAVRVDTAARRLAAATGLALLAIYWSAVLGASSAAIAQILFGVGLFVAGVLMRAAAMGQLGAYFRTEIAVQPDQRLVRSGIYRHIRHPSEGGLLLIGLGAAVLFGSTAAFAIWGLVLVPLVLTRIRLEESCLRQAYGGQFESYVRASARLLPPIL